MEVKCPCQNCGQNISFPVEAIGLETNCPHCGQSTKLAAPVAAVAAVKPVVALAAASKADEPKRSSPLAVGCACLAGLFGLFLLIPMIAMLFESPQATGAREVDSTKQQAHYAAEQFIRKAMPGAKTVASYRESVVEQEGSVYRVAAQVDGVNAFGGPLRKIVGVEMELSGGKWVLKRIQ